jgi:MFS transporter, MHS family, proline/betaine transporter
MTAENQGSPLPPASETPEYYPNQKTVRDMDPAERKTLHRAIAGSALGNAVEWFDYAVYGYLAIYMGQLFLGGSGDGSGLGVFYAFLILAISFFFRPLGGIVLGPLGDKVGRQKVLVLTITMMTGATAAIGLLPPTAVAGMLGPTLLILLRIIQGFSAGGEYGGAAVFMAESAPDKQRGFYGSFLELGTLAGTTAGASLCTVMILLVGDDGMLAGWWRLPFLVTLPLGLVALWLRVRLTEPEVFSEAAAKHETTKRPLRDLLRKYWRQILVLMGFVVLLNIAYYLILTYMPAYLSSALGLTTAQGNFMLVAVMIVMMIVITPMGALTDRVGRKPLLLISACGHILLSIPSFMLINSDSVFFQFTGLGILGLLLVILIASVSSTLPAIFPTQVRYSGFAIGYNISTAIFGGTAATVNEGLINVTGNNLVPGFYLMAAGVVGFISIMLMRETAGRSLRGDHLPGSHDAELKEAGFELIGYNKSPNPSFHNK